METQRIINEEFETLMREIENLRLKNKLYFERSKRLQETNDEKYNQFQHGVSWGHLRCLQLVTAWVRLARKKILRQMEGNALPESTSTLVTAERITDSTTDVNNSKDYFIHYYQQNEEPLTPKEEAKALLYVNDKAYQKGFKDGKMEAMKEQWKPNEKQMDFLKSIINEYKYLARPKVVTVLQSLYNNLKEL